MEKNILQKTNKLEEDLSNQKTSSNLEEKIKRLEEKLEEINTRVKESNSKNGFHQLFEISMTDKVELIWSKLVEIDEKLNS